MKERSKYFFLSVFTVLIILNLTNCKKYPEDPHKSLKSTKARYKGSWNISYIKLNGTDFTQAYADSLGIGSMNDLKISNGWGQGYSHGSKEWTAYYSTNNEGDVITDHPNIDGKSELIWYEFTFIRTPFPGEVLQRLYGTKSWKILKLYKGKMMIEKETVYGKYEMGFEKKD